MHAFPHHQVHTVATKEQAGVKKAARSMRSLRKNDALTLFNEWTMDSPFDTKGGIVYSPVDTKEDSTLHQARTHTLRPWTRHFKTSPHSLSAPSPITQFLMASSKASRWVELCIICPPSLSIG